MKGGRIPARLPMTTQKQGTATREVGALTRPSNFLEVAPELQGLAITNRLREAYDRLITESMSLHELLVQQVSKQELPDRVLREALQLANTPKLKKLMPAMSKKAPLLHDFVVKLQGAIFVENLLQGEITDGWLQKKRAQIYDRLTQAGVKSHELLELLWKPYQQRPPRRPSAKAVDYLRALDFKNENPTTSWGELARKFCNDPSQANTLKTWAYRKKTELAAIGVHVRLDNPDYQQTHPPHTRKIAKPRPSDL